MKLIWFILILTAIDLRAQPVGESDYLESAGSILGDNQDLQQLREQMELYRTQPLALNVATHEQLRSLTFLSELQVVSIINYRKEFGAFSDWLELPRVPGLDSDIIGQLKIYCTLEFNSTILTGDKINSGEFEQTIKVAKDLTLAKGYRSTHGLPVFAGSALKLYTRTRYALPGKYSAGILTEKDPGEPLLNTQHPYTPDYTSIHILVHGQGKLKSLVIGDYNFSSGLGLVCNPTGAMFKSEQITQVYKPFSGFRPYTSVNESGFFRGVGARFGTDKLNGSIFTSFKKVDATIDSGNSITSLYNTGLHRTTSELQRRKAASQLVLGGAVQYKTNHLQIDLSSLVASTYVMKPVISSSALGAAFTYQRSSGMYFGELAISRPGKPALIGGFLSSLSRTISMTAIFRNYPVGFISPFGSAFSNSGKLSNERGWFMGLETQLSTRNKLSGYLDQYVYPEASFYTNYAANQKDFVTQYTYTIKRRFLIYLRGRWQCQQRDLAEENMLRSQSRIKANYRIHAEYIFKCGLTLKQRLEVCRTENRLAWLGYQDVIFKRIDFRHNLSARLAFFNSLNYDDRIYAYENDLLYSYAIPAYFNNGMRYYLMIHGPIDRALEYWIRYGCWIYKNQRTIGSGNDEINGNKKPQLEIQLRLLLK